MESSLRHQHKLKEIKTLFYYEEKAATTLEKNAAASASGSSSRRPGEHKEAPSGGCFGPGKYHHRREKLVNSSVDKR